MLSSATRLSRGIGMSSAYRPRCTTTMEQHSKYALFYNVGYKAVTDQKSGPLTSNISTYHFSILMGLYSRSKSRRTVLMSNDDVEMHRLVSHSRLRHSSNIRMLCPQLSYNSICSFAYSCTGWHENSTSNFVVRKHTSLCNIQKMVAMRFHEMIQRPALWPKA